VADFDYIVVGAGSAGCALVNRLVADPANRVLLIEAGGEDNGLLTKIPRTFIQALGVEKQVWTFPTAPGASGPNPFWVRGKLLGGSSAVNGMVYMRGRPDDYDGLGLPGWDWAHVGRAFAEMENHQLGAGPDRGSGGPLDVTVHPDRTELCDAMIEAASAEGAMPTEDLNQEDGAAVGYQPCTVKHGIRVSAAKAFLEPIRHARNLTIMILTETDRIIFEGKRAIGVQVRQQGGPARVIHADKEIILSAGALNSPKLLMLSGIGPAATLKQHGIDVLVDAPDVGQNLSEQLGYMPMFRLTHGSWNSRLRGIGAVISAIQYALFRKGPLAHACFELSAVLKTGTGSNRPDAVMQFNGVSLSFENGKVAPEKLPGAMMSCYTIRPKSRGYMTITSADPQAPVHWDPKYMTHEDDRKGAVEVVRAIRKITSHPALKKFGMEEIAPGPAVQTEEQIVDYFLKYGTYAYHALGTCRMGSDAASVVDPSLKVRGVEGLRVADISVLPEMVNTHTNAPAMMIGWRAGEIIRAAQA
jgi:choline dehydrogenase-like flavoprotein